MQRAPSDSTRPECFFAAATVVLEGLPLPVLVVDRHERIRFADAPIVHLFGYAQAELIDRACFAAVSGGLALFRCQPYQPVAVSRFQRPTEATLRMQGLHKDGTLWRYL